MIELVFYCVRDTTNRKSMLGMKVCPMQVIGEGGKKSWHGTRCQQLALGMHQLTRLSEVMPLVECHPRHCNSCWHQAIMEKILPNTSNPISRPCSKLYSSGKA